LQWFTIDSGRISYQMRACAGRAYAPSPAHHCAASPAALHCPHHRIACDVRQLVPLHPIDLISWQFSAAMPTFDYKYIIRDADSVIRWEKCGNHKFLPIASNIVEYHDWLFRAETDPFMGAGISIAFDMICIDQSLCGFGKFSDLKILIDWSIQAKLLLVQLGLVQDVNFSSGPKEAPPDRQMSIFASDPIYLVLREMGDADEAAWRWRESTTRSPD
jgi:hypothetical protein